MDEHAAQQRTRRTSRPGVVGIVKNRFSRSIDRSKTGFPLGRISTSFVFSSGTLFSRWFPAPVFFLLLALVSFRQIVFSRTGKTVNNKHTGERGK